MVENTSEKMLINYNGPFGIQIISGFAKFLTDNIQSTIVMRKKIHRVFIELSQNVALYSAERVALENNLTVGIGHVIVTDYPESIKCITMNRIAKEHAPVLIRNCQEINQSTPRMLKERKRNLHKLANSQDTGAHLGLIMIYTHSENPLECEIISTDDQTTFFKITSTINKTSIC